MPATVLERQRVKILSLVNSKLTFAHHLSFKKQLHSGPLGVNTGIVADFVKCRMVTQILCTLSDDDAFYKPHYFYFHWLENRVYIKVSFT